ncbi:MAG: hypothetical protein AM1032_000142 [Mycoplasmataceae bacterium]|nr:MAG: hypothetical protein AM1032_000142 [Mycoplasmataceae bacterium]
MNKYIKPSHTSVMLLEDFLEPNNITIEKLSDEIKMSVEEINYFLIDKNDFTLDFSQRLAAFFEMNNLFFL